MTRKAPRVTGTRPGRFASAKSSAPSDRAKPETSALRSRGCVRVGALADAAAPDSDSRRAWEAFQDDLELRRAHNISAQEMEMLSEVALMGQVQRERDFIYILNILRAIAQS